MTLTMSEIRWFIVIGACVFIGLLMFATISNCWKSLRRAAGRQLREKFFRPKSERAKSVRIMAAKSLSIILMN